MRLWSARGCDLHAAVICTGPAVYVPSPSVFEVAFENAAVLLRFTRGRRLGRCCHFSSKNRASDR